MGVKHIVSALVLMFLIMGVFSGLARGQDLVYQAKNPAFGGSPLNYSWMMNSAQTQNPFKITRDFGYSNDPLANFQQSLQRQILSELTRKIVNDRFGDIDLTNESNFSFGEFSIDVVPGLNGVEVRIYNAASGEQTSITIPNI